MIKLTAIGNLGRDAVMNTVSGKNVINFTVAHTEKFKDAQGNQKDKTVWVDCAYWTEKTGIAPYLKKGTQVYADGIPDLRNYTTQDGRQGTSLALRVNSVQLLGSKPEGAEGGQASYSQPQQSGYNTMAAVPSSGDISEPADDLPF